MACAANAVSCVRNDSTGSLSLYLAAPVPRSRLLPFSLISSLYRVFQKIAAKFQVAFLERKKKPSINVDSNIGSLRFIRRSRKSMGYCMLY